MYSKKLLEKFKNIKLEITEPNLLDSISINNLFNNDIENNSKNNEKDINKDTINLKSNISINSQFSNNQVNFSSQSNIKNFLFQNNVMGLNNNYIYNNFTGIIPNSQNDIFMNKIPSILNIPNNLNLNPFYSGPKNIQKNFGNEIRPNILADMDNKKSLEPTPFYQLPLQNHISMTQLPNNIITNNIPNNFLITNNTNIKTNSNININNNINFDTKNIINKNINNNININSCPNPKINKETISNVKINKNPKIIFSSKIYNNINEVDEEPKNTNENVPIKKKTPLFNIKEIPLDKEKTQKIQLTSQKRKRFIKNKKLVFVQVDKEKEKKDTNNKEGHEESEKNEENEDEDSLNSEKMSELMQKNTKPRGSRYRGVSKNGSQWQALIMVKKKKRYLGSFSNEEEAARAYDKVALQHHGIKAKTNYDYTKEEIKKIIDGPKLLKLE